MKIFTLTSIATSGVAYPPGIVIDYKDDAEAKRHIAGGNARKPSPAELALAVEREKAKANAKKAADADAEKTAEIIAEANAKRLADAKKADGKKREKPKEPGRPKKAK